MMVSQLSWRFLFACAVAFTFAQLYWQTSMRDTFKQEIGDNYVALHKLLEKQEKLFLECRDKKPQVIIRELPPQEENIDTTKPQNIAKRDPQHASCSFYNNNQLPDNSFFVPRKSPVKIYDTFLLLNEVDVMKIRVNELYPYVDYFIVAESNETFTGKKKNRHLWDRRAEFADVWDKIRYVNCEFPETLSMESATDQYQRGWEREAYSRQCLATQFQDAADTDYIIVGDVDEIPKAIHLQIWKDCNMHWADSGQRPHDQKDFTIGWIQERLHFNFHCESPNMKNWHGSLMARADFVKQISVEGMRGKRSYPTLALWGGWHFSNFPFGDFKIMMEKFASFSHQEETAKIKDPQKYWEDIIKQGQGDQTVNTHCVEQTIMELPQYVWKNWARFAPFLNEAQLAHAKKYYNEYSY